MIRWSSENAQSPAIEASAVPKLTVETFDNHIYFYSGVDPDRCLALVKTLRELDAKLRNEHSMRGLPPTHPLTPIWLHIESPGGGLFTAFGVASQIEKLATPVYSIVEGYAASAATIISCACHRRFISPNGFMLIHQLSSFHWGKYEEFKDEMKLLDMAMKNLVSFYARRTRIPEETVMEFLKRDTWFNADECIGNGLVEGICSW